MRPRRPDRYVMSKNNSYIPTALKIYIDHVNEHELLSNEETIAYAKQFRSGDPSALDQMFYGNLRLVIHIAKDVKNKNKSTLSLDDLIQFGNIGLYQACERFDPDVQQKFSSYAGPWIKHTIERGIENEGAVIRHPVSFYNRRKEYKRVFQKLTQVLGREPNQEEVLSAVSMSKRQVLDIENDSAPISTDKMIGDEENSPIINLMSDEKADVNKQLDAQELEKQLHFLLKDILSSREYRIVIARTGLLDGKKRTLEDIGAEFSLSRERIRQLYEQALKKMFLDSRVKELKGYLPHDREKIKKRAAKKTAGDQ